jgi:hypothetical protein
MECGDYIIAIVVLSFLLLVLILHYRDCNKQKCYYPSKKNKAELIKTIIDQIQNGFDNLINQFRNEIDQQSDTIEIKKINNRVNVNIIMSTHDVFMYYELPNLENASEDELEYVVRNKDKQYIFESFIKEYGFVGDISMKTKSGQEMLS